MRLSTVSGVCELHSQRGVLVPELSQAPSRIHEPAAQGPLAGSKIFPELFPLGRGSARLPEPGTQQQPPGRVGAAPPAVPAKTPTPETVRQEKREQKFTFSHLAFLCTQLISA